MLLPLPGYAAWLSQFLETKEYATNTIRYVTTFYRKPKAQKRIVFRRAKRITSVSRTEVYEIIRQASRKHRIHPDFIKSVVSAESDFNNRALSSKGAMGLMQLMPATCRDLGVSNPWNPKQNVMGGTRYLKSLLSEFKNPHKALAAYNFGPNNVRQNKRWPKETRIYVARVMKKYRKYRSASD